MTRAALRSPARWLALAVVAAAVVGHITGADGEHAQAVYLSITCLAAPISWIGAFRGDRPRAGRVLLASGITLSALGDLAYASYEWLWNEFPNVSVADIAWLASYLAIAGGMIVLLRQPGRLGRRDVDGLIDTAVMGVVSFLVVWQFWVEPTLANGAVGMGVRSIWASYPILDAALFALVGRTLTSRSTQAVGGGLVAAGVLCWLGSDLGYLVLGSDTALATLLDGGWMLGAALLGAAVWRIREIDPSQTTTAPLSNDVQTVSPMRFVLGLTPLMVPGVLELIAFRSGKDSNPAPLLGGTAVLIGLAAVRGSRVIGAARRANTRMARSERRYRALSANSSDAVVLIDADGRIVGDSQRTLLAGRHVDFALGSDLIGLVAEGDRAAFRAVVERSCTQAGDVLGGEFRLTGTGSSDVWIVARVVNLLEDGDVEAIVVTLHDITARKQAENELTHHAFHDSLTGLANRALFWDRIDHALDRRGRTGQDPSVLYIDLDGFKGVNDTLGHDAGDALLRQVATRIGAVVRSGDTVARLGGDEFAVLIEDTQVTADDSAMLARRIIEAMGDPVSIGGRQVSISASVGVATADADSTPTTLLRDADIAMYRAKASGKGTFVRFEPAMRIAAIERLQIESDLGNALAEGQFTVAYQPVLDLDAERVIGFEALIRWNHPTLGNVPPDRFIPIAEQTGLIVPIGLWVLRTACVDIVRWQRERPEHHQLTIAVNLSARQLTSPTLLDDVREALDDSGLDPASLILEMTETALVSDPDTATRRLAELRTLGIRLAIDDFGTGYSSLSYLRQFPVDILKIDRSFVNTIQRGESLPPLVRGLLDLAHTLDLEIVAEGIETPLQLELLRSQQCGFGQGYLFAKAIAAPDVARYLEQRADSEHGPVPTG